MKFDWAITWPGTLSWLLGSFVVTFLVSRLITHAIRSGRGPFSDVAIGELHVHHMVWGVGLVLLCGMVAFAFKPGGPLAALPAVGFGAGAALVLDEFALMLYLRDVYWAQEGRLSLGAVGLMAVGTGMIALPLSRSHLPHQGLPVVIAIVTVYVLFTAVCLAKGKVYTSLVGLFIPYVGVYGGLRLARPNSPWAQLVYRRNPTKLRRARVRYGRRRRRAQVGGAVSAPSGRRLLPRPGAGQPMMEQELWLT